MARLVINNEDYASKLANFDITCMECSSHDITLDIDWAAYAYPSASWCRITTICNNCHKDEELLVNIAVLIAI